LLAKKLLPLSFVEAPFLKIEWLKMQLQLHKTNHFISQIQSK
jgi:hypothetical protein